MESRCSNNQAEQLAIIKALETIESINTLDNNPRTASFHNSRISLDSLHKANLAFLIEEIRKSLSRLEGTKLKRILVGKNPTRESMGTKSRTD